MTFSSTNLTYSLVLCFFLFFFGFGFLYNMQMYDMFIRFIQLTVPSYTHNIYNITHDPESLCQIQNKVRDGKHILGYTFRRRLWWFINIVADFCFFFFGFVCVLYYSIYPLRYQYIFVSINFFAKAISMSNICL